MLTGFIIMSRTILNSFLKRRNFSCFVLNNRKKINLNSVKNQNINLSENWKGPTWSQICWYATSKNEMAKSLIRLSDFENIENKNKESYIEMVNIYKSKEIHRRAHVEFIYAALKYMKEFGVEKDLEVYKSLVDVFPKGKMVPRNRLQVAFMHYPKQQQCAIDLLEQMEDYGVMPDWDMEVQLINVFGKSAYPLRRYWRMMYWMPKLKHASPWPLPDVIPNDSFQLAKLAIERIMSVDPNTTISIFKTSDVEGSLDDTWIVSGQSIDQIELINNLSENTPLFVEGRYRIWVKNKAVTYFVLRADILTKEPEEQDYDDVSKIKNPLFRKPDSSIKKKPTVHEQEDGIILAVCSSGTSSRDSLLSWIRCLEKLIPKLTKLPVVFTLKAPSEDVSLSTIDADDGPLYKRIETSVNTK